jgi:hypothetical protein
VTLYPNTRPAESWDRRRVYSWGDARAFLAVWAEHGGRTEAGRDDDYWWDCIAPKAPHPDLHSPEVMSEDPTTERCDFRDYPPGNPGGECRRCGGSGTVTVPGRSFVAWHTLGATIPEGWEWFTASGRWLPGPVQTVEGVPYLVREPLTPPDPPCPACRVGDIYGDEQNHTCGRPLPVRVDPPEGAPPREIHGWEATTVLCVTCPGCAFTMDADHVDNDGSGYSCPVCAEAARVEPPSGVQVIGWTEPTDDQPRSLPIVLGENIPDGWVRRVGDCWQESGREAAASWSLYVIRPVPVPPAPETERRWFTVEVSGLPESVDDGEVRGELASAVARLHREAGGAGLAVGTRSTRTETLDGTDGV